MTQHIDNLIKLFPRKPANEESLRMEIGLALESVPDPWTGSFPDAADRLREMVTCQSGWWSHVFTATKSVRGRYTSPDIEGWRLDPYSRCVILLVALAMAKGAEE